MICPQCHNEMRSLAPKSSPKAPDFVCDIDGCGKMVKGVWRATAVWLDRLAPKQAPNGPGASSPQRQPPKWTWDALAVLYKRCILIVEPNVVASAERLGVKASVDDVLKGAHSVFIEACKSGVEPPKAKLPPKPVAVADGEPEHWEDEVA